MGSKRHMHLYWLYYRHNNQISVVIEPDPSLVHAGMRTALAELDSLQDLAILGLDGCRLTVPFD
jgi:hypothetical protein